MADEVVPNSVGWYILEGFPWWPVYICDVTKLRPNLHLLGSGHKKILKKARDFPEDFIVVYYFGSHDFSLVQLKKGVLRPWDCPQKDQFLKGHPKQLAKKKVKEELLEAVQEAEEYLSQPEDIRLPQHMVPSDLDPTLEPPPPELVPQEMGLDPEDEEDEEAEMMDVEEEEEDEEEADNSKKAAKEKKAKKEKKEKKKKAKEKKDREKKEKKAKKAKSKVDAHKKRKTEAVEEKGKAASPTKVAKTAPETDVKSERSPVKKEAEEKKPPPADMTTEALSIILEKEIRWILVNCPFEEMTTKSVRKQLEKRLKMDLRHHKASIKEGVARVIASMEEDAGDSASTAPEEAAPAPTDVDVKADVKAEVMEESDPVPTETVKKEVDTAAEEEAARAEATEKMKKQLEATSKDLSLALDLEPKIMDALNSLMALDVVDRGVLAASTLQPRLVKLRAHRSPKISDLVALLVKKWNVEELIPAPKPVTKEDILELKTKLEDSETSHDELLVCLSQLNEMPLKEEHLKKTGIARSVSKLRQHGNDKVSSRAHDLRKKWIKQVNEQPADNDSGPNPIKTLKTLNKILEQHSEGANEHKLQSKQVAALDQLLSMKLDTQDIIDSKVGISVSKLRKSSNDKIATLAKKLRKKWQAEAKAKSGAA